MNEPGTQQDTKRSAKRWQMRWPHHDSATRWPWWEVPVLTKAMVQVFLTIALYLFPALQEEVGAPSGEERHPQKRTG